MVFVNTLGWAGGRGPARPPSPPFTGPPFTGGGTPWCHQIPDLGF